MEHNHSRGLLLAVQQQMVFAGLVADQIQLGTEKILIVLAEAGLCLQPDDNNILLDASVVYPRMAETMPKPEAKPDLKVVQE